MRNEVWRPGRPVRWILSGLVLAGLMLGLFQSIKAIFHLWGVDSDIADPVLLWQGVRAHGVGFVTIWRYTQDNWLLSLMPLDFLVFSLVGDAPGVLIATGAGIFCALVTLTGILVGRERGALIGAAVAAILLFAGRPALGSDGFLAYPVSHGISLAWGLAGLLLATVWLDRRSRGWLIASGACLFVGMISDPWTTAAFAVPMTGAALVLVFTGNHDAGRMPVAALVLLGIVVGILSLTKLFGVLSFLPGPYHSLATWTQMKANFVLAFHYITSFLNLVPTALPGPGRVPDPGTTIINCGIFFGAVTLSAIAFRRRWGTLTLRRQFVGLTALLSMLMMMAALVVTGFADGMVTARYLANIFVFFPILLTLTPVTAFRSPGLATAGGIGIAALFVVSGVVSNQAMWTLRWPTVRYNGIPQLSAFLSAHGLSYGYGPYWATQANAVAWVTGGQITIRPVKFDSKSQRFIPKPVQTLASWYTPSGAVGAPDRMAFIVPADPARCAPALSCTSIATKQFGPAAAQLHYRDLVVLVYQHPVFP